MSYNKLLYLFLVFVLTFGNPPFPSNGDFVSRQFLAPALSPLFKPISIMDIRWKRDLSKETIMEEASERLLRELRVKHEFASPDLEEYQLIREILDKLLDAAAIPREDIELGIIFDEQVNAFIVPHMKRPHIVVSTGLFRHFHQHGVLSRDTIAAVLAHEISHKIVGHYELPEEIKEKLDRLDPRKKWSLLAEKLFGKVFDYFAESHADRYGLHWMDLAGFDVRGGVAAIRALRLLENDGLRVPESESEWKQLKRKKKKASISILRSHPPTAKREMDMARLILKNHWRSQTAWEKEGPRLIPEDKLKAFIRESQIEAFRKKLKTAYKQEEIAEIVQEARTTRQIEEALYMGQHLAWGELAQTRDFDAILIEKSRRLIPEEFMPGEDETLRSRLRTRLYLSIDEIAKEIFTKEGSIDPHSVRHFSPEMYVKTLPPSLKANFLWMLSLFRKADIAEIFEEDDLWEYNWRKILLAGWLDINWFGGVLIVDFSTGINIYRLFIQRLEEQVKEQMEDRVLQLHGEIRKIFKSKGRYFQNLDYPGNKDFALWSKIYYRAHPDKFESYPEAEEAFAIASFPFDPNRKPWYPHATVEEKKELHAMFIDYVRSLSGTYRLLNQVKSVLSNENYAFISEEWVSVYSGSLDEFKEKMDKFISSFEFLNNQLDTITPENLMNFYDDAGILNNDTGNEFLEDVSHFLVFVRELRHTLNVEDFEEYKEKVALVLPNSEEEEGRWNGFLLYVNRMGELKKKGVLLPYSVLSIIEKYKDVEKIASFQKKHEAHYREFMKKGQNAVFHGWHPGIEVRIEPHELKPPLITFGAAKSDSLAQVQELVEDPFYTEMFSFVADLREKGAGLLREQANPNLSPQAWRWLEWLRFNSQIPTQKGLARLRKLYQELKDPKVILEVRDNLPLMEFYFFEPDPHDLPAGDHWTWVRNELGGDFVTFLNVVLFAWGLEALIENKGFSSPEELGRFLSLLTRPMPKGAHYPELPKMDLERDQLFLLAINEISSLEDLKAFLKGFNGHHFYTSSFSEGWKRLKEKGVLGKVFETDWAFVSTFDGLKGPSLDELIATHGTKKKVLKKVLPVMIKKEEIDQKWGKKPEIRSQKYKKRVKGWINSDKKLSSKEKLNEYLSYGFIPTQEDLKEFFNIETGNWESYQTVAEILREKAEKEPDRFEALVLEWGSAAYEDWQNQNQDASFSEELEILIQCVPPHPERNPALLNLIQEKAQTSAEVQTAIPYFVLPPLKERLRARKDEILIDAEKTKKEIRKNLNDYNHYEKTKIPPEKLKKPEEAYQDEDFLGEKILAGRAGWEKAEKESRIGQNVKEDLDLLESLFPDFSASRDKLLDELLLKRRDSLGFSDFKRGTSLYTPFIQPQRGALFFDELLYRHFLDPGFTLTPYEKKLIQAQTRNKGAEKEDLLQLGLIEKVRVLYLLESKWKGMKEVGPSQRKAPAFPGLGFNDALNSVLLPLFPRPSHIRDELIRELENFKARRWEEVKLSQELLFENSEVSREEATLTRNAALQTLKDTVKIISADNKAEVILWLLVPKYEKPFVVKAIENGSGYSLDYLKERRSDVSRADREAFLREFLEGDEGIFTSRYSEVEERFLNKFFSVMIRDVELDGESKIKYKLLYNAVFQFTPNWKKTGILLTLIEKSQSLSSFEELVSAFLESYGLMGVKMAQILVSRGYVSESENLLHALRKLTDQANPLPVLGTYQAVTHLFSVKNPHLLFREIGIRLGSASVSQVHEAVLATGEEVVLKVLRPGLESELAEELKALGKIILFINQNADTFETLIPEDFLEITRLTLEEELDFTKEAENLERLSRNMASREREGKMVCRVPKVFSRYSNQALLTEEKVNGIKLDLVPKEWGLDLEELRFGVLEEILEQIVLDGFYHADPHEGNILVTPKGELYFIDAGKAAVLSSLNKRRFFVLFDIFSPLSSFSANEKKRTLEDILVEFVLEKEREETAYINMADLEKTAIEILALTKQGESDFSKILTQILLVLNKHHIPLPEEFYNLIDTLGETAYLLEKDPALLMRLGMKLIELRSGVEPAPDTEISKKIASFRGENGNGYKRTIRWGEPVPAGTRFQDDDQNEFVLFRESRLEDASSIQVQNSSGQMEFYDINVIRRKWSVQMPEGEWADLLDLHNAWKKFHEKRRVEARTDGVQEMWLRTTPLAEGETVQWTRGGKTQKYESMSHQLLRFDIKLRLKQGERTFVFNVSEETLDDLRVRHEGEWLSLRELLVTVATGEKREPRISSRRSDELDYEDMRQRMEEERELEERLEMLEEKSSVLPRHGRRLDKEEEEDDFGYPDIYEDRYDDEDEFDEDEDLTFGYLPKKRPKSSPHLPALLNQFSSYLNRNLNSSL